MTESNYENGHYRKINGNGFREDGKPIFGQTWVRKKVNSGKLTDEEERKCQQALAAIRKEKGEKQND